MLTACESYIYTEPYSYSLFITGFVTGATWRVPLVEQELLTISEHLSPPWYGGVVNGCFNCWDIGLDKKILSCKQPLLTKRVGIPFTLMRSSTFFHYRWYMDLKFLSWFFKTGFSSSILHQIEINCIVAVNLSENLLWIILHNNPFTPLTTCTSRCP